MLNTHTKTAVAVALAGILIAAAAALPASGQDDGSTTLTFTTTQTRGDERYVDLAPKGASIGDRFVLASTVRIAGKPGGRVEAECVAVDRRYGGLSCSGAVLLAQGSLTFHGATADRPLPGGVRARRSVYAITGGTGVYAGASGTATRTGNGKVDRFVLVLRG